MGATLWAYKGISILASGNQPDHTFEIAPFFFGISAGTLLYAFISDMRRPRWLLVTLAWLAMTAGAVAAVAHLVGQEDDFGDLAYLVNFLSTVVLLFLMGGDIRRGKLLSGWSFTPTLLAWGVVLAVPVGAVLEGINERYLEIALLAVVGGWLMLGVGALSRSRHM